MNLAIKNGRLDFYRGVGIPCQSLKVPKPTTIFFTDTGVQDHWLGSAWAQNSADDRHLVCVRVAPAGLRGLVLFVADFAKYGGGPN